ncbi:hypothetical protein VTL71DRAFT_5893 [Oculimacula yallundae]|uniref:Ankyrin n=1 Tax=Oculimacula yallundae TaxID=86028 RepID=A0ABR4C0B4_9HELO
MRREDIVKLLLDAGADVDIEGGEYRTALIAASRTGMIGIMKLLIVRGADVNIRSGLLVTALQAAMYFGDTDAIKLLLDTGANVQALGRKCESTLHFVSRFSKLEVMKLLIDAGADVNATAVHYGSVIQAASASFTGSGADISAIKILLDAVAVVELGNVKIVEIFIEAGGNVDSRYHDKTALQYVLSSPSYLGGREPIVSLLIAKGANTSILDSEQRATLDQMMAPHLGSCTGLPVLDLDEMPLGITHRKSRKVRLPRP